MKVLLALVRLVFYGQWTRSNEERVRDKLSDEREWGEQQGNWVAFRLKAIVGMLGIYLEH